MTRPYTAPTLIPASRSDEPLTFLSIDALALQLLRARPGRKLDLLPQQCSRDGGDEFPVVAVFAVKPAARRPGDPAGLTRSQDDWLGWACGDRAADPVELAAALKRMASAGGLAE